MQTPHFLQKHRRLQQLQKFFATAAAAVKDWYFIIYHENSERITTMTAFSSIGARQQSKKPARMHYARGKTFWSSGRVGGDNGSPFDLY